MLDEIIEELSKFTGIIFLALVPACLIGAAYWRTWSASYRWLVVFLWFDFCIELGARVMTRLAVDKNNLPLLHLYTFGELILWSLFFKEIVKPEHWFRRWFAPVLSVMMVLVVANSVWFQPITTFNSYAKTLVQLFVIVLCLDYEFAFISEANLLSQREKPFRWINRTALLYYAGSMFVFMFSQYAPQNWTQGYEWLWNFNVLLNALLHLTILISLWKAVKTYRVSPT